MTANLDFVVGRYHERPFAVCEQTRMMASTLSDSVSSIVGSLSGRSEEHKSELQSLMRISYAVFCLKHKKYTASMYSITSYTRYEINRNIKQLLADTKLHNYNH